MRKRKDKSFDRDFDANRNSTVCYIHNNNDEISVILNRIDRIATLGFSYNGVTYKSNEIEMSWHSGIIEVDKSQIRFDNFDIKEIDLTNLANCLEEMFEKKYGLSD